MPINEGLYMFNIILISLNQWLTIYNTTIYTCFRSYEAFLMCLIESALLSFQKSSGEPLVIVPECANIL